MKRKFEDFMCTVGNKAVIKMNIPAKEENATYEETKNLIMEFSKLFAYLHHENEREVFQKKENFFIYEDVEYKTRIEYTICEDLSINMRAIIPQEDLLSFVDIYKFLM